MQSKCHGGGGTIEIMDSGKWKSKRNGQVDEKGKTSLMQILRKSHDITWKLIFIHN